MIAENAPDNLLIAAFNYTMQENYFLLSRLSNNIRHPLRILHYFGEEEANHYALFHANLNYFNTEIFLLKNYKSKQTSYNTLFDEMNFNLEYLIDLKPPKMYLLLIYSEEIKDLNDVSRFFGAEQLFFNLSLISSKKLRDKLHTSVQMYVND